MLENDERWRYQYNEIKDVSNLTWSSMAMERMGDEAKRMLNGEIDDVKAWAMTFVSEGERVGPNLDGVGLAFYLLHDDGAMESRLSGDLFDKQSTAYFFWRVGEEKFRRKANVVVSGERMGDTTDFRLEMAVIELVGEAQTGRLSRHELAQLLVAEEAKVQIESDVFTFPHREDAARVWRAVTTHGWLPEGD